jgi:hypothetical protein
MALFGGENALSVDIAAEGVGDVLCIPIMGGGGRRLVFVDPVDRVIGGLNRRRFHSKQRQACARLVFLRTP